MCDGRHDVFLRYDGLYGGFGGANVGELKFPSDVGGHFREEAYLRINFAPPYHVVVNKKGKTKKEDPPNSPKKFV